MFLNWLADFKRTGRILGTKMRSHKRRWTRLQRRATSQVEALEERVLLTTFTVTNLNDAGAGSLRQAIIDANGSSGADDIVFQSGLTGTLALTSGEMSITESVTITGNGAADAVIDAQQMSRIFNVSQPGATVVDVSLTGLALNNGFVASGISSGLPGGAVLFATEGTLAVNKSSFTGNSARQGGAISALTGSIIVDGSTFTSNNAGINGGAIQTSSTGALTVSNSTFTNNTAALGGAIDAIGTSAAISTSTFSGNKAANGNGGALAVTTSSLSTVVTSTFDRNSAGNRGGAITNGANPLQVTQSTFYLNSASGNGGGIYTDTGTLTLRQSTLHRNSAISQGTFLTGNGGGVFSNSATLVIQNSIFDDNLSTSPTPSTEIRPSPDAGDNFFINNSLVSDNRGTGLAVTGPTTPDANGNLVGDVTVTVTADLGDLQDNGGPIFTLAPIPTSSVVNRGSNAFAAGFPNDQRGAPFVRNFGGTVDMGAVEVQTLALVVDTNVDEDDGDYSAGDLSLREAIRLTSANPGADTITFAASTDGTDFDLSLGAMTITGPLTITGNGAANTVIDGQLMSGVFNVTNTAGDLSVSGLSIVNGSSTGASAISSASSGTLTVIESVFSGNVGGVITHRGPTTISRSTFSNNTGRAALGILGTLTVTESTFVGNTSPGFGGAIAVSGGTATITQSTFSGNSALFGGAIYTFSRPVVVIQSTIAGNHADTGGGIYSESAPVTIRNSIVAGNSDGGPAPDLRPSSDSVNDPFVVEFSLIGTNTGTGLTATGPTTPDGNGNLIGDAVGIDPLLAPLANNGGPTQTRALLAGSPAFNTGSNTIATPFTFDQRGASFDRIVAGTVDMGAFESPPQTDVQVTKTAPLTVVSGQDLSYTITVTNAGPSDAQFVVVPDMLPTGTTFVSLTQDSGPSFNLTTPSVGSGGNVILDINTLASGATATFTLVVNVGATVSGHIDNRAQVATTTLDTDASNNSSTATTVALLPDDLQIHKDGPAIVDPGATLTYTITIANTSMSVDAQTVVFTDTVPANTTFVSITQTSGLTFTPVTTPTPGGTGLISLETATLPAGSSAAFTLVVRADSGLTSGTITNTALVASATPDSDLSNNASTATTNIAQADVEVSKNGPATVNAGENLTYTITFSNTGPNDATDVTISDVVPTGSTFVSLTQNAGGAGFTTSTPGVGNNGTVTISTPSLAVGVTATYTMVVRVPSGLTGGFISNTATATSVTPDPDASNNSSTVITDITTQADLQVLKTGPASVVPGQEATYTITANNNGPSDALDVAIVDTLLAGTTFVSLVQNSGPTFSISTPGVGTNGTVSLDATTLASGATATFTLVVNVDPALTTTTLTNTAAGTTSTTDPNTNNNTGTVISNVTPQADLQIVKMGPVSVISGQQLTYTIEVNNNGSSNSPNSTIADSFAGDLSNVTWTAVFAGGATGNASGSGDISENVNLPSGSSVIYTVTGLVNPLAIGTLGNTATVTPPGTVTDLDLSNNSSTVSTLLSRQIVAYGTGPGIEGQVTVVNSITQDLLYTITPFPGFTGGVHVAVGDVNGDMVPDVIAAAGPGATPHVKVYNGADGSFLYDFFAYDSGKPGQPGSFPGGVFVAAADLDGDGKADIITGAGAGATPHVRVFSGADPSIELFNFFAYDSGQPGEAGVFGGGVQVAAGDITGDGIPDIITGAGPNGGPHVRVFDGSIPQSSGVRGIDIFETMGNPLGSFFPYNSPFAGGVFVAAGDVDGDGRIDLITGAGPTGGPHVRVFDGSTQSQMAGDIGSFFAYDSGMPGELGTFTGGVRVVATDITGDGKADIITAAGPDGGPHVRAFQAGSVGPEIIRSQFVESIDFKGGIFVAASTPLESTVSPLTLASGFVANDDADQLTLAELQTAYQAAVSRLETLGLSATAVDSLSTVALEIADLNGGRLGESVPGTIRLDTNAAGIGWYVDPTPLRDEEFTGNNLAATTADSLDGVDLLTVLLHEIIHQLGGEHVDGTFDSMPLMTETLPPAQRRLPSWVELDQAFANQELLDELFNH